MTKGERELLDALAMIAYELELVPWLRQALDTAMEHIQEEKASKKGWR